MKARTQCTFLSLLFVASTAHAAIYHVAITGSDAVPADGSASMPWRTISRCAMQAQPGDVCRVHGGTYREQVVPPRSGIASAHIRFEAAAGECVTVSGADVFTSAAWSVYSGSIWATSTSARFVQLFSAGRMLNEARWPNADPDDLVHMPWASAGTGTDQNGLVATDAPAGDWTGARILVLPGSRWLSYIRKVTSYNATTRRITFDSPLADPYQVPAMRSPYYLFGSLVALDSAGEWFLDTTNGMLYLWPPGGVNPSTLSIEIKQRSYAFDVSNQSYIDIVGFHTFATAIRLNNANHCVIDGVNMEYVAHGRDDPYSMTAGWPGPEAPAMVGNNNTWKNSVIAQSGTMGLGVSGNDNLIANNVIHDVAYMAPMAGGIEFYPWTSDNQRNTIVYNTVSRGASRGICVQGLHHSRVLFNRINDVTISTYDTGGISGPASTADGQETEIAYNEISNMGGVYTGGIYLDESGTNFILHHNYVHDVSWNGIHINTRNAVFNNTLEGTGQAPIVIVETQGSWDPLVSSAMVFNNMLDGRTPLLFQLHPKQVTDFGDFQKFFVATDHWQHVTIPFSALTQAGYGVQIPLDLRSISGMNWEPVSFGNVEVQLDNIRFEGPSPTVHSDFESGKLKSSSGQSWWNNGFGGGSSRETTVRSGAGCSLYAAELAGNTFVNGLIMTGIGFGATSSATIDLSSYTGISFDVRAKSTFWLATKSFAVVEGQNLVCPLDKHHAPTTACGVDSAQPIPPFTDGYAGAAPDIGAFESGRAAWTAGAQFVENTGTCDAPPDLVMLLPPGGSYPTSPGQGTPSTLATGWPETCAPDTGSAVMPGDPRVPGGEGGCGCRVARSVSNNGWPVGLPFLFAILGRTVLRRRRSALLAK